MRKDTVRLMLVERVALTNLLVFPGKGLACD
ncbi:BgTH12-07545 [Blumeria graminis f. sp. triticale]|uniref:BgTH12-07545 n=1 Tax=Blumeria graminis f. sp. triticale TaxID=1689686 RepID=A0A9W4CXG7_BLUGR|nr:BgTH12-07545 [Blumeria graminis f. sp. triticale]